MDDVDALLDLNNELMVPIQQGYVESLASKTLPRLLPARVKNVLENQRSALDYIAVALRERYATSKGLPYYPMSKNPAEFAAKVEGEIPGLTDTRIDIVQAIERHQPYNSPWLRSLSTLTRENKHRRLTPQTRIEQRRILHESTAGSVMWAPDQVTFGEGVTIGGEPVDPVTQRPAGAQEVVYVDWLFAETNESVIDTLSATQRGVREAVRDICSVAAL